MTPKKPRRLSKKSTPPDVWKAHRKLRKKIASAKWYAKKKKGIVEQQEALQTALYEAHRDRQRRRLWTLEQFQYWRCATEHALHDFPVRPTSIPPAEWLELIDLTYAAMARMEEAHQDTSWYTRERKRTLKHLALAELLRERTMRSMPACRKKNPVNEQTSIWKRWTAGIVPSVCTTLGWMLTGMVTLGIHATHWPWFCRTLHEKFPEPHPHVWLDEDIQHLNRELDRLCSPDATPTQRTMDELDSIPSSLDSFLNDAFGDIGTGPNDPEKNKPESQSLYTEPASFDPSDWIEWELDDHILPDPPFMGSTHAP